MHRIWISNPNPKFTQQDRWTMAKVGKLAARAPAETSRPPSGPAVPPTEAALKSQGSAVACQNNHTLLDT